MAVSTRIQNGQQEVPMRKNRRSKRGVLLIQAIVVLFILSAVAGSLLTVTTSGTAREQSRDFKFKSREIAEAALDLSLNALRQATDQVDNDGDGTVDEGYDDPDLFVPSTVAKLEGNLGRVGTLNPSSTVNEPPQITVCYLTSTYVGKNRVF